MTFVFLVLHARALYKGDLSLGRTTLAGRGITLGWKVGGPNFSAFSLSGSMLVSS